MHRAISWFAAGAVSLILSSAATAQTIISTSVTAATPPWVMPEYYLTWTGITASWTQTNRFTNVTVSAMLCCGGAPGGTEVEPTSAYLTTRIGIGTTINDTVGSNQVVVFSEAVTNVVLFNGLTLEPGTYYLTLLGGRGGWVSGCTVDFERAGGVTLGPEYELVGFGDFYGSGAADVAPKTKHFTVVSGTNLVEEPASTNVVYTFPEATPQHITVIENMPKRFSLDVSDADGGPLSIHYNMTPTNGIVTAVGVAPDVDWAYRRACFPLTELTYTPAENYVGTDYFNYTVGDWHQASGRTAFVTIEVLPPPLGISVADGGVRLSWAANCPHYEVETAASLGGDWETAEEPRNAEGDYLAVIVNRSEAQKFFRLRRAIQR